MSRDQFEDFSRNFRPAEAGYMFPPSVWDFDLTNARDNEEIGIGGDNIFVEFAAFVPGAPPATLISTVWSVGEAYIRPNRNTADPVRLIPGTSYRLAPFSKFFLTNAAQANKMLRVIISTGAQILPFSAQVIVTGISAPVKLDGAATIDSKADVSVSATTTAVVSAAVANRRTVLLSNPVSNTREFRIGDSGAGAANGVILNPGDTFAFDTVAAVYAYNPHGAAQSISVCDMVN